MIANSNILLVGYNLSGSNQSDYYFNDLKNGVLGDISTINSFEKIIKDTIPSALVVFFHAITEKLCLQVFNYISNYTTKIPVLILNQHSDSNQLEILKSKDGFTVIDSAINANSFKKNADAVSKETPVYDILRYNEEKFKMIADFSPDIINLIDMKSKKSIYFNKDMVFGYSRDEFLSLSPPDLIHSDDSQLMDEHWKRVLENKSSLPEEVEFRVKCKDNSIQWVQMRQRIISLDDSKKPEFLLAIATPIDDRKLAEIELVKANTELDNFLYRASHDLKSPMKSIKGLVNLIKMEKDDLKKVKYLDLINISVEKLDNYVSDMTNYSRNNKMDIEFDLVDFEEIYHDQIDMLQEKEYFNRIQKIFSVSQNADFVSDKMRISILFSNILSNAIKFQNLKMADSFIKININVNEDVAVVSFIDNGIGIKPQYIDKVFDMFFKGADNNGGSGLGLYVVQQIVYKLHGTIEVKSEYGEGSVFTLTIPNRHKHLPK
ncbi:MAG: PAS domain-containing sensor histidine kinase [Bacteroidota bacterium]|nr:PAS domain-containing sensor histidine kinase [Bacteroidota bacterium]